MQVLVLSDTHMRPGLGRRLPDSVYGALEGADAILHAGDVVTADLLDELAGFAPVHAVLGNNDTDPAMGHVPETLVVDLAGVRIGMVHDSGPAQGRAARLRAMFPDAAVVVFGHSHIPWDEAGVDGQWLFNPGSPTERRSQPVATYGELQLVDGQLVASRVIAI